MCYLSPIRGSFSTWISIQMMKPLNLEITPAGLCEKETVSFIMFTCMLIIIISPLTTGAAYIRVFILISTLSTTFQIC